jgi:NAD(P)-dependent dehydrogenase (short-subunit alcohol dehydrogenase family)
MAVAPSSTLRPGWTLRATTSPAYAAGKSAVHALTVYIATQYGKQGIRCNCIAPGLTLSPQVVAHSPQFVQDLVLANTMAPRLAQPEDTANAFLFLASDRAAMINGEVLSVDGGHRVHQPQVAAIRDLFEKGQLAGRFKGE